MGARNGTEGRIFNLGNGVALQPPGCCISRSYESNLDELLSGALGARSTAQSALVEGL